jgi:hypothetical protein
MYSAKLIRITQIDPHPGADRLQLIKYGQFQFVVDLSFKVGDLICMFPTDGQLSQEFCKNNNLYRDSALNADTTKTGFFETSRRVRAQPFRKEKSEGFVCKLDAFNYLGKINEPMEEGLEFNTLNGHEICTKYVTEATRRAREKYAKGSSQKEVEVDYNLKKHYDTEQLDYNLDKIGANSLIIVSEKLHGTSGRTGLVRVSKNVSPFYVRFLKRHAYRLCNKINLLFKRNLIHYTYAKEWMVVSGTRNTICNTRDDVTQNGRDEHYRWIVHNQIAPQLYKGETIFYEIVGFNEFDTPIMNRQNTEKLQDKSIREKFGKEMTYRYGCNCVHSNGKTPQFDVYVYRITMQNEDDVTVELPFFQVQKRSKELGLKAVPVLATMFAPDDEIAQMMTQNLVGSFLNDGPSTLDESHLMEGVVVRVESERGVQVYKSKNFSFKVMEGILKENPDMVDTEEAS